MKFLKRLFDIRQWTYKELFFVVGAFLVMNLLAPRGFVQWVLLMQDIRRVKIEMNETQSRVNKLQQEIHLFQNSTSIKEQKLRELGYLKPGEISLEFLGPSHKNVKRENASSSSDQALDAR